MSHSVETSRKFVSFKPSRTGAAPSPEWTSAARTFRKSPVCLSPSSPAHSRQMPGTTLHDTLCAVHFSRSEENHVPLHTSFGKIALLPLASPLTMMSVGRKSLPVANLRAERGCVSEGAELGSGSTERLSCHSSETSTSSDGDQLTSIVMDEVEPSDIVLTRAQASESLARKGTAGRPPVASVPPPLRGCSLGSSDGKCQVPHRRQASRGDAQFHHLLSETPPASALGHHVRECARSNKHGSKSDSMWAQELKDQAGKGKKASMS